jgi:hypothetical protein
VLSVSVSVVRFGGCVLAVVAVALLASGCGGHHRAAQLPPVTANPQRVVTAYVNALDAHDVRTARALLTPAHARLVASEVDSWFTNVKSITHLRVSRPTIDRSAPPAMHAAVSVHFVLDQYKQESMPNGPTDWGYTLVRNGPNQRWLIDGEGMG